MKDITLRLSFVDYHRNIITLWQLEAGEDGFDKITSLFYRRFISDSQLLQPSVTLKSEIPLVGVLYYELIIVMTDDEKSENVVHLAIIEYFWQTRNFHVDPF